MKKLLTIALLLGSLALLGVGLLALLRRKRAS